MIPPFTIHQSPVTSHHFLLLLFLLCVGCAPKTAESPPTPFPQAAAPVLSTYTPTPFSATPQPGTTPQPGLPPNALLVIPTPVGTGISPSQAQQLFVPDAGPQGQTNWRPPTYPVPLAIHPDDHYWLIRPIPANGRNYDLEWYPYGNDVLVGDLAPYRIHHGLDFPNDSGTPVLAAGGGTVIYAGPLPSPRDGVNYYGNTVIIQHDWTWLGKPVYTLYAHTLELFVEAGQHVEQGQLIAGVGSSGEVTGPHLHFEVRVGENHYNEVRNPLLWLSPFEGYGTLAGQFADRQGRLIPGALVTVETADGTVVRTQRTYYSPVKSDEVWQENFVFGDMPVGEYVLLLDVNGIIYRREVTVKPAQTNFVITATEFEFIPTLTPIPSPTPQATPTGQPEGEETAVIQEPTP